VLESAAGFLAEPSWSAAFAAPGNTVSFNNVIAFTLAHVGALAPLCADRVVRADPDSF